MAGAGKAGAYRPSPLGRTFVRVPLELISTMLDAGMPIKWAVMLAIMSYCGKDEEGTVWASCARSAICGALGITERQARNAASSLIRGGILSVLEPGHNGRATVYRVNLKGHPVQTPTTAQPSPTTPETTPTTAGPTPSVGAGTPGGERGVPGNNPFSTVGACPEATPNRTLVEGSYRGPSSEGNALDASGSAPSLHEGPRGDGAGYITNLRPLSAGELSRTFPQGGDSIEG